jgi:hypothetical protein
VDDEIQRFFGSPNNPSEGCIFAYLAGNCSPARAGGRGFP